MLLKEIELYYKVQFLSILVYSYP